jgi:hypothetical protein
MGDSRIHNLRVKHGLKYVRVLEERLIDGRWFPHYHVILLIQGVETSAESFQEHSTPLRSLWADKARKIGMNRTLSSVQDAKQFVSGTHNRLAGYLTENGRVGLRLEMDSYDLNRGSFTPFELFQIFVATGDVDARSHWEEFEFFSSGKHRFTYSVKARSDLKLAKTLRALGRQNSALKRP